MGKFENPFGSGNKDKIEKSPLFSKAASIKKIVSKALGTDGSTYNDFKSDYVDHLTDSEGDMLPLTTQTILRGHVDEFAAEAEAAAREKMIEKAIEYERRSAELKNIAKDIIDRDKEAQDIDEAERGLKEGLEYLRLHADEYAKRMPDFNKTLEELQSISQEEKTYLSNKPTEKELADAQKKETLARAFDRLAAAYRKMTGPIPLSEDEIRQN